MLKSIDHINIVVKDLGRMTEFFLKLGFRVEDQAELSGEWISSIVGLTSVQAEYVKLELPGSSLRLELIRYDQPECEVDSRSGDANRPGLRHLAFEVTDIDQTVKELEKVPVTFVGPVQTYEVTGKRLVYFHGPEGLLLELAEYP